jgi:hypothetical protein
LPKPRVQRGEKEHEPQKDKKGGENNEGHRGDAKLAPPPSQQSTCVLQASENHAEVVGDKNRIVLGKHSHLWPDV